MRGNNLRLLDVMEAIEKIEREAAEGREAFDRDERLQVWVVYHLQVVGEASRNLTDSLRAAYAEVDWSRVIGMRNILVHHYFGINHDIVWNVVQNDLPELKSVIARMIAELPDEGEPPAP